MAKTYKRIRKGSFSWRWINFRLDVRDWFRYNVLRKKRPVDIEGVTFLVD